jgi:hypothetical protein
MWLPLATDLTDLASVEAFLGLASGNANEQTLQWLINTISVAVADYLGHPLAYQTPADWTAGTVYANGQLIKPTNISLNPGGYTYRCSGLGTTAASEPAFGQTVGQTITDNTVTWMNVGLGVNVSELRSGTGQQSMMLQQFPVISLGSVEIYGVNQLLAIQDGLDGALLEILPGIRQRGMVHMRGLSVWPFGGPSQFIRGQLSVRFNYQYGYWTPGQVALGLTQPAGVPSLPQDIKGAVAETVALRFKQSKRWGDVSLGEGPQRLTFFMEEMYPNAAGVFNRYRETAPVL